jgi:hypothetical protein
VAAAAARQRRWVRRLYVAAGVCYLALVVGLLLPKTNRLAERHGARLGAICSDGWHSRATGRGACSHNGGVREWLRVT